MNQNIDRLLNEIIPPNDYQHREGFTNEHIIDNLDNHEKELIEDALIDMLHNKADMLVVETLAYMKSVKALPILTKLLNENSNNASTTIIITTSIFQINQDPEMIVKCINAFKNVNNNYGKISAFYYLAKFNNKSTDGIIKEYTRHPDDLLSYNAKRALRIRHSAKPVTLVIGNIMKTVAAVSLKAIQYFLLGGIPSFLLLLYLVITDPYFEKLDWKIEGFGEKVSVYHIYTQYIPMAFIACCGIYSILLAKIKRERVIRGCAAILALILFAPIDIKIKYLTIVHPKIVLNIGIIIVFYIVALIVLYIYSKRVNR